MLSITDNPPKSKPNIPKFDTLNKPKMHDMLAKELHQLLKSTNISSEGNAKDLRYRCKLVKPEIKTKKEYGEKILAYIGM